MILIKDNKIENRSILNILFEAFKIETRKLEFKGLV